MKTLPLVIAITSSLTLLGGCATSNSPGSDSETAALRSQLNKAESRALENAAEASRLRSQLGNSTEGQGSATANTSGDDLLPPNAMPGHCYARVLLPAKYEVGSETILARGASERIDVTPAEYRYVEETVRIQEESTRLEVVPATYKMVSENIVVEPEKTVLKEIPAEFETVTEKILVKPAYTTWKKGRGPMERLDSSTGEIMCLIEVPAEYQTVTKKVVRTPARTVEEVIPANYETVSKKIVDTAAVTREIVVPAQYDTIKVRKIVSPASANTIEIPAEYKTVATRKLVQDSSLEWREILCETNTSPGVVARLQTALNDAGFDAGSADGILGNQTVAALKKYQVDNNMARGQLTLKVLESLNVSL